MFDRSAFLDNFNFVYFWKWDSFRMWSVLLFWLLQYTFFRWRWIGVVRVLTFNKKRAFGLWQFNANLCESFLSMTIAHTDRVVLQIWGPLDHWLWSNHEIVFLSQYSTMFVETKWRNWLEAWLWLWNKDRLVLTTQVFESSNKKIVFARLKIELDYHQKHLVAWLHLFLEESLLILRQNFLNLDYS